MRFKRQVELVERFASSFLEHRSRGESIYAVERLAQLLIQALLDLGAMIAVYTEGLKPETYKGIARLLAEKLGLTSDDRELLEGLAGFRNLLVHGYAEIDRDLEERAFKEIERDLPGIVKAVKNYVVKSSLDPLQNVKLENVFKRHGVKYAYLFGSKARGGRGRDYDIAVFVNVEDALKLGKLLVDVAEALGVHEDQVDLVHLDTAPLHIVYTVLNEGKPIYGDPEEAYYALYRKYLEFLDMNESERKPLN